MSEDPANDVSSGLHECNVTGTYDGVDGGEKCHYGSSWKRPGTREC